MGLEGRFAYDTYRAGQRELAERVYEACVSGETLVAEAMSGFGKTAAVLSGAVSAAEQTGCRVVYACRTKRQIHRVLEEVSRLQKRHPLKAASLVAKFDYCLLKRNRNIPRGSFGWYCSFNVSNNLCSYFMNVSLAPEFERTVRRFLVASPSHAELLRESESIHVCPYEVSKLALAQADLAVVPYHYVFDPRAALTLFGGSQFDRRNTILVVDEAHNLRDFLRGLSSYTITLDEVEGAAREADVLLMEQTSSSIRALCQALERTASEKPGWLLDRSEMVARLRKEKGGVWLQNLAFELASCSGAAWGSITYERRLPSLVLHVGEFLSRLCSAEGAVLVKWERSFGLIDPDPVRDLALTIGEYRSAVLLSATISPSELFLRSLGLDDVSTSSYSAATEPAVTVRTVVDTGVSTRYKLRSPENFARISARVAAVIRGTPGGVGVFVPSYSVLNALAPMVKNRVGDRPVVCESPGLSGAEAGEVFEAFRSSDESVLFAVQGGRFSEGEDFAGDSMGAVVVVGLSLPPPSPMLYAEYACLKRAGEPDSYLMLSRLPALRKAFQAAGRHIRNPGKRGLVVLMDERFGAEAVRSLMPSWLQRDLVIRDFSPPDLETLVKDFWDPVGQQASPA